MTIFGRWQCNFRASARKTRYRKTRAKVNTAFNDEFATNDKRANKNMREWYEQHIGVSIYLAVLCNYAIITSSSLLASVEEFQERDSE